MREWTDRSRRNLRVDTLDLVQLHCPTSEVYSTDRVFDDLDTLVDDGAIAAYGVSVETCAEALAAIARPGVATVQIILNAFRLKPLDEVLPAAKASGVPTVIASGSGDPVATGLVESLPRPGGNVTGIADDASMLSTKRLSLLKALLPK